MKVFISHKIWNSWQCHI